MKKEPDHTLIAIKKRHHKELRELAALRGAHMLEILTAVLDSYFAKLIRDRKRRQKNEEEPKH